MLLFILPAWAYFVSSFFVVTPTFIIEPQLLISEQELKYDMPELLNCAVCGGCVSSDARNCPHCGSPNYKTQRQSQKELNQLKDEYERKTLIEKDRQLKSVGFTHAYGITTLHSSRVRIEFTGKGLPGGIAPPIPFFWLDGHTINGKTTYDLAWGSHTVGIGLGTVGYPVCDVTKEFTVSENTRCIEVKYKLGFLKLKILSVEVQ